MYIVLMYYIIIIYIYINYIQLYMYQHNKIIIKCKTISDSIKA